MLPRIAVDGADEALSSLLRASCLGSEIRTESDSDVDARAERDRLADGSWEMVLTVIDESGAKPLVRIPGDLLEREQTRVGVLIDLLITEVCRRREAAIALQIQKLACEESSDSMYQQFVESLRDLSGATRVSLLFPDSVTERFEVIAGDPVPNAGRSTESDGHDTDAGHHGDPRTVMLPLHSNESTGDDVFGFVRLETVEAARRSRAETFIERASPMLHSARALSRERELALRDDLTRAYNRRYFDTALHEEIERSRRFGTVLSLIFLDLDDLKVINSRWGHLTGSRVLQEVARRILGAVRTIDRVVRFGGDEFCILLPQTDTAQAHLVAERVRDAIANEPIRFLETEDISLSASFGIASYPMHSQTRDGVIRAADAAMYAIKRGGKNAIGVARVPEPLRSGAASP